ncbi:MAG: alpha/beta fold hydrolase [Polyangiaceae bacterium]|nr:alpha/beta fold hydrolase [Polyangiaceae bacterium]
MQLHLALRGLASLCIVLFTSACAGDEVINPVFRVPPLQWSDCGAGFECAMFPVPLQHSLPANEAIEIPVIRKPAADPQNRIGSLFVNPGGPGGSGVAWVRYAHTRLPADVTNRFDIIGFDPRGVGGSLPAVDCLSDLDAFIALDLSPDDATERARVLEETKKLVNGCEVKSGDILPYIDTESVARDMNHIRVALGEKTISYVGFSYGTLLGAMYAELYPSTVRAFILDGAVDPSLSGEDLIMGQALSFEEQLNDFLAMCAADLMCELKAAGNPADVFDALQTAIETEPMPALGGDGRSVGPGELWWGVSGALYSPKSWPELASALAEAATVGDATGLLELSDNFAGRRPDGSYSNSLDQYHAVFSIDNPFPANLDYYEMATVELRAKAPRLGASFAYSALPSALWPLPAAREPAPVAAEGAAPILVIGTTHDPATPYAWAVSLASQLESGALLTRNGYGHTGFGGKSECVDAVASKYLIDLEVPDPGTECD